MTLIHASELDTSPPLYVVEGMLPDMGCGFGYGGSYTGKSLTLGVELCLAIANGVPFLGHETVQGATLWALGEGLPDAGVRIKARLVREQYDRQQQAAEIARTQDQEAAEAWLAGLPAYTDDRMYVRTKAFPMMFTTSDEPEEKLRQAAREMSRIEDLRLVVLDTARRFTPLSLSNGTTSNRFMMAMSWLSNQLQCTVMAIGHPVSKGRGEVGLPGDTLFGASDFVWLVKAGEDSTDEVPNAMVIAEKVKTGPLFAPIPYELERIQWQQPATDPDSGEEIPGETVTVRSVTIRQRADEQDEANAPLGPPAARAPLPQAEPVPSSRPRRRTGIRPRPAFRQITPAGQPEPSVRTEDADAAKRAELVAALLSGTCPDTGCSKPPGTGCNPGTGEPYVVLDLEPLAVAHTARVRDRLAARAADADTVLAQFDPDDAFLAGTRN